MEVEDSQASLEEAPISPFPADPRFASEAQFDLVVQGNSINKVAQDGDRIRCVSLAAPPTRLTVGHIPRYNSLRRDSAAREFSHGTSGSAFSRPDG